MKWGLERQDVQIQSCYGKLSQLTQVHNTQDPTRAQPACLARSVHTRLTAQLGSMAIQSVTHCLHDASVQKASASTGGLLIGWQAGPTADAVTVLDLAYIDATQAASELPTQGARSSSEHSARTQASTRAAGRCSVICPDPRTRSA